MPSLNLSYVITSLEYGGAQSQIVALLGRLKARGWDARLVSMLSPSAFTDELKAADINVETLNMRRGVPNPTALIRLVRILRRHRPHIVHSHLVHANLLSRLARPFTNVPSLICTAHSIYEGPHRRALAYRVTDRLCDLTTQVSMAGVQRYVETAAVPKDRIRYVPNGVDVARFKQNSIVRQQVRHELGVDDEFLWLAVGRLEKAKDYPNMLQALARLAHGSKAILMIVGEGVLKRHLEDLARELSVKSRVRFLGVRKDIPALMNAADGFVLSSAWEGLPMVLLEAAASSLPVVSTNVGGSKEIVLEAKTGFLVPPSNSGALAGAMTKAASLSNAARLQMGTAARAYVEQHYSLDMVVDTWESIYMDLIGKQAPRQVV
jgi:glycosyltransferase involved in cell wall biosynthesis